MERCWSDALEDKGKGHESRNATMKKEGNEFSPNASRGNSPANTLTSAF